MRPIVFALTLLLAGTSSAQQLFQITLADGQTRVYVMITEHGPIIATTLHEISLAPTETNPYPVPSAAMRQAVEPLRQLTIAPADGKRLAEMFDGVAKGIDAAQITSTPNLDEILVAEGTKLGIKGKYPNLSGLLDKVFQAMVAKPGDAPRFLTDKDAEVVCAVAWALWRAN